jgi:hypothetical protein
MLFLVNESGNAMPCAGEAGDHGAGVWSGEVAGVGRSAAERGG